MAKFKKGDRVRRSPYGEGTVVDTEYSKHSKEGQNVHVKWDRKDTSYGEKVDTTNYCENLKLVESSLEPVEENQSGRAKVGDLIRVTDPASGNFKVGEMVTVKSVDPNPKTKYPYMATNGKEQYWCNGEPADGVRGVQSDMAMIDEVEDTIQLKNSWSTGMYDHLFYGRRKNEEWKILRMGIDDGFKNDNKQPIMTKLTNAFKKFLSPSLKAQVEAGFRGSDLELTPEGNRTLMEIVAEKFDKEFTDKAKERVAENKADKDQIAKLKQDCQPTKVYTGFKKWIFDNFLK